VVQTAFLGDVVLATPLLQALRLKYPPAHLALLTTPMGAEILAGLPALDEIISFDKRKQDRGARATLALGKKLREARFDLALCPHRSARTAILAGLARIPRRIGFADSAWPWLYQTTVVRDLSRHEVWRNLQLLDPLGGTTPGFQPALGLGSAPSLDLERLGLSGNGLKVGLCPGSVWPTKRWTAQGYAGLADLLQQQFHAQVFLLGAPEDAAVAAEVEALCRQPVRNLAGRTTLPELVSVIDRMNLLVTNDSAPVHIASARRVPVVAIFGPTVPAQGFAPFQERAAVVELPLHCRPCGAHGPRTCPLGHFRCMNDLRPDQVLSELIPLLSGRG
jgi:heptosyltransferase-2